MKEHKLKLKKGPESSLVQQSQR
uniref:Uncharacterized protein n=1 Tax=Tetranychus urticae TaxID=32264 RepID=T1K5M3_TETUR